MALDAKTYRTEVLARLLEDFGMADPETGDLFAVCGIAPDTPSEALPGALKEIKAFWNKDLNHPKYKSVVKPLLDKYAQYEAVLSDPRRRLEAATRVTAARQQRDHGARDELDGLARKLVKQHGGIPAGSLPALRAAALRRGLGEATFNSWLAGYTVHQPMESALAWDAPVRRQIRNALRELTTHTSDEQRYHTLWTMLGLAPGSSVAVITIVHERLQGLNSAGARDRVQTLTADLLATVKTRLMVDGGPQAYEASIRADASDAIYGEVEEKGLFAGSLTATEIEVLTARIVGLNWGLDSDEARGIVMQTAKAASVPVESVAKVDLIVCGSCNKPQQRSRRTTCQYCRAALFIECPACRTSVEAAVQVCPSCGLHLRAWTEGAKKADAAAALLESGQPAEALTLLTAAEASLGGGPVPARLTEHLAAARDTLGRARQEWSAVESEASERRYWAVARRLDWLRSHARDLPGPDGKDANAWRAQVADRQSDIQRQLRQILTAPGDTHEQSLLRLRQEAPDSPEVEAAWTRLPLEPPRDLVAVVDGEDVDLTWTRSPGRDVTYRVERIHPDGSTHPLGSTTSTALTDGRVPGGVSVRYRVTATSAPRVALAVESSSVLIARDISAVQLELVSEPGGRTAIRLRWPAIEGVGAVRVDRTSDGPDGGLIRFSPKDAGVHADDRVETGATYTYRVYVEYHSDGHRIVTPGRTASLRVPIVADPVAELWANTGEDGATKISFTAPPKCQVLIVAAGKPLPFMPGLGLPRRLLTGEKILGPADRRVIDRDSRGLVHYMAFTVAEDGSLVSGAAISHLALPAVKAEVVSRDLAQVQIRVELPEGASGAVARWRHDRSPDGLTSGAEGEMTFSSGKLAAADGIAAIPCLADGRDLHLTFFPIVTPAGGGPASPYQAPVRLSVPSEPVELRYRLEATGWRRRRNIEIRCDGQHVLPALRVLLTRPQAPLRVLHEYPGGAHELDLSLEQGLAGLVTVTVVSPGRANIHHPAEPARTLD